MSATSRRRAAIASVLFAMAAAVLDASSVNIALPSIASVLHVDPSAAAWLVIAYQGALVAGLLPLAAVGERFGYRPIFAAGIGLFGLCAAGSALSHGFVMLVAFRIGQGIGAAAIMALGVALLRQIVAEAEFGKAIGWNAMTVALTSAAAPAIGAMLLGLGSWRFLFAGSVALAGLASATAFALPPTTAGRRPVDGFSPFSYAVIVAALVAAAGFARALPVSSALILLAALVGMILLVRRDRTRVLPFLPLLLFRSASFTRSVLASVACFAALSLALLMLPFALHDRLGLSVHGTAMIMTTWPIAVLVTTPVTARLLDHVAAARLCVSGAFALACGLVVLAMAASDRGVGAHIFGIILCGAGFGLFQTPNNRTMFLSAPVDRAASAGGVQGTARLSGQVTGALIASIILAILPASDASDFSFGVAALVAISSAAISSTAGSNRERAA